MRAQTRYSRPSPWWSLLLFLCVLLEGQAVQNPANPAPGDPSTAPLSSEVEAVLERIERCDNSLDDLQADLKYWVTQGIKADPQDPDEVQEFEGQIKFVRRPLPSRFMIYLKRWNDGITWFDNQQEWYIFDGQWFTRASQNGRIIHQEQILRPGETTDVFKLGHGPFPMPFGQSRADIIKHFHVHLEPPAATDPAHTDHLRCFPKTGSEMAERFAWVELFVLNDAASPLIGLPVKILAYNKKDETRITAEFRSIKRNIGLDAAKSFKLPPETQDWEREIRPLGRD